MILIGYPKKCPLQRKMTRESLHRLSQPQQSVSKGWLPSPHHRCPRRLNGRTWEVLIHGRFLRLQPSWPRKIRQRRPSSPGGHILLEKHAFRFEKGRCHLPKGDDCLVSRHDAQGDGGLRRRYDRQDREDHLLNLQKLLDSLRKYRLPLNPNKCASYVRTLGSFHS